MSLITSDQSCRFTFASIGRQQRPPAIAGFTMVELLVAVVVMTIGLLGMAGLQTTGLSTNQSAYFRSQATIAASDIIDRMRANTSGVAAGHYDTISSSAIPNVQSCITATAGCNATELADYDKREWLKLFSDVDSLGSGYTPVLPGGSGTVTRVSSTNVFVITVQWKETDWSTGADKDVVDKTLSLRVNI